MCEKARSRLNYEFIISGEDRHGDGDRTVLYIENLGTKLGSIRKLSLSVYRSSSSVCQRALCDLGELCFLDEYTSGLKTSIKYLTQETNRTIKLWTTENSVHNERVSSTVTSALLYNNEHNRVFVFLSVEKQFFILKNKKEKCFFWKTPSSVCTPLLSLLYLFPLTSKNNML